MAKLARACALDCGSIQSKAARNLLPKCVGRSSGEADRKLPLLLKITGEPAAEVIFFLREGEEGGRQGDHPHMKFKLWGY